MNPTSDPALSSANPPVGRTGLPSPVGANPAPETFQHYQVLRREDGSLWELGRGAMGVTYKAFDTNLRCFVALKVISAQHLHSEMAGQRFIREARVAARLRHRNIATVYHLGVDPQSFFYSMEFIDGETLEDLVRRVGPLPLETVLGVAHQTARALAAASRQGLIHRDLKPANIMVLHQDEEGEDRLLVKVIDFGLARTYAADDSSPQLTATGFVGTPLYASPEQLEERPLDVRSDIYSLGITLWILLTGRPPFAGKMTVVITQHLNAEPPWWQLGVCPEPARALLGRMLAKDPAQRYQTAGELRRAIEACLRDLTGQSSSPAEGVGALVDQSFSAAWPLRTEATDSSSSAAGISVPYPATAVAPAERAGPASDHQEAVARDAGTDGHGAADRWRRLARPRLLLAAAALLLLVVLGFAAWRGLAGAGNATRAPGPGQARGAVAQASPAPLEAAPTPIQASTAPPVAPPAVQPGPAVAMAPVGSPGFSDVAAAGPGMPPAPVAQAGRQLPTAGEPSPAADAFDPEVRPVSAETPEAAPSAAPTVALTVAGTTDDEDADPDDTRPDGPAKARTRSSGSSQRSHARHHARSAPTPAPNLFQRIFGLKPKPRAN